MIKCGGGALGVAMGSIIHRGRSCSDNMGVHSKFMGVGIIASSMSSYNRYTLQSKRHRNSTCAANSIKKQDAKLSKTIVAKMASIDSDWPMNTIKRSNLQNLRLCLTGQFTLPNDPLFKVCRFD